MTVSPNDPHWFSPIESPLILSENDHIQWAHEADVVIVGLGAAGVSAAIEARDHGADVMAIDRFEGGGDTALSGGVVYAGGGTHLQRTAGFEDSADNMFNYLQQETQGIIADSTLKDFCQQSVENIQWLEQNGVKFDSTLSPIKTSYPAKPYYLYFSGNESVPSYAQTAKPIPRGHRAVGKGLSGYSLYAPLHQSAKDKGVRMLLQSRVSRFVVNQKNEIEGLEIKTIAAADKKKHAKYHRLMNQTKTFLPFVSSKFKKKTKAIEQKSNDVKYIKVNKGVVLSCGGFVMNRNLLKHYAPKFSKVMALGTTGADGAGLRLGQTLGGASAHLNHVSAWRFINPPITWAKGVLVNAQGRRYVNEQCYGAVIGQAMCEDHGGKAYIILNRHLLLESYKQARPGKVWIFQTLPAYLCMMFSSEKANTLAELAVKLNMPAEGLEKTMHDYHQAALGKSPDEMGKADDFIEDISQGPFYALNVSDDNKFFPLPAITLGGLQVNEETGAVKNQQGEDIPKLFAAGRTAIGVPSKMYVSGLSLADCIFSGRRAAKFIARED